MKKKQGRPIKVAPPAGRANLALKVTSEMKNFIDNAAKHSGRTQSQEGEFRLEISRMFVSGVAKSSMIYTLGGLMMTVFEGAGNLAAKEKLGPDATEAKWMADDYCYEAAVQGVLKVLRSMSPSSLRGERNEKGE